MLSPHPPLTRYYETKAQRRGYLDVKFDSLAPHYDWVCQFMSLGSGNWYRRRALQRTGLTTGMRVLDVACGTGVIAAHATQMVGPTGRVVAMDPSTAMLHRTIDRDVPRVVRGVAESQPFADSSFDLLSMGYALRHVEDLATTFREYLRVLKPGGTLLMLEVTPPRKRWTRYLLKAYMKWLVPLLSGLGSRSRAVGTIMAYNWDSIEQCVPQEAITSAMRDNGFERVAHRVEMGIFTQYTARRPL